MQNKPAMLAVLSTVLLTASIALRSPAIAGQTQAEMNRESGKDYRKADAEMNTAYKRLMAVLKPDQKDQLQKAQRAWLKFRDAEAPFLSSKVKGGTVYPTIYHLHLAEITTERTKTLKATYRLFTTDGVM